MSALEGRISQLVTGSGCARPSAVQELRDASLCAGEVMASDSETESVSPTATLAAGFPAPESEVPECSSVAAGDDRSRSDIVFNRASGIRHRILIGPPILPTSSWITHCAWRFGLSDEAAQEHVGAKCCLKCFSQHRATYRGADSSTTLGRPERRSSGPIYIVRFSDHL